MKRLLSALFVLIIVIASVTSVSALDYGCTVEPVSTSVYVEELNTGTVVYELNADERIFPASTTKIMTYIIVAENVPDLDGTKIEVTTDALADMDPESSVMGLTAHIGESFSVRDLLYGLMLPSGNDAALVLADYVGHGVSGFVDLMNRKAAQLGCKETQFRTPHGLHDSQHYTTLHDMAIITKYAMKKKDFMEICNTTSYTPAGFSEPIKTTNYLIDDTQEGGQYYYPYAKGIKTGYTDEAGKCLVSTAEYDGCNYLCLAFGSPYSFIENVNYAMLDTSKLYKWAFENLAIQSVSAEDVVGYTPVSIPVEYVWGNKKVELVPSAAFGALLPNNYDRTLISINNTDVKDTAEAPVKKGDVYGKVTISYDGVVLGTADLVASEDIDRQFTNYILHVAIRFIKAHVVIFIIAIVVLIVLILVLIDRRRRRKALLARRNNDAGY